MLFFTVSQFVRMLHSVQGVSPMWLICAALFCDINLGLAYQGWRETRSKESLLLLITHASWVITLTPLLILLATKASQVNWGWYDKMTFVLVLALGSLTILAGKLLGKPLSDPIIRGVLGAILRGIPHIALAYKIWLMGGGGIATIAVWTAHGTALVRIGQLASVIRKTGWQRTQYGIALAEGASELTWALVTVIWLIR